MGQILSIGIITQCSTSKKNLQKYKISKDELIANMTSKLHFEPAIYDFSETKEDYVFTLKSNILETQLLPFLENIYPFLYPNDEGFYEGTIEMLKNAEPSTWLELCSERSEEEFQFDEYGSPNNLYFDKPFNPSARIHFETIMLSHEGKIMMEVYGRQFNFFKYCIQQTFSDFSIAKALNVYISG
jgi:hypothetical protein